MVTLIVSASSANLFALELPSVNLQIMTMIISYIMWSIGIMMATIIISVHYWRLFVFKIPPTNLIFTTFLPSGVCGQSSYFILLFGNNIYKLLVKNHDTLLSSHFLHIPGYMDISSVNTLEISISMGQVSVDNRRYGRPIPSLVWILLHLRRCDLMYFKNTAFHQ